MNPSPVVAVLLATYSGERFLREQIESVLAQTHANVQVMARDDGSHDATVAILQEYARRLPERFVLLPKDAATGSARLNFLRLMEAAEAAVFDGPVDYFAFCDQDDVWLPEKIALEVAAMERLRQQHGDQPPLLVFSDLQVVDEALAQLHPSLWANQHTDPATAHRLPRILSQNVVTGCTMLINRSLLQLALSMPPDAFMHDWWIALLACAFGHSAVVRQPTVLYRQHGANVVGAGRANQDGVGAFAVPRWRDHGLRREQWTMTERQAAALLRVHGAELTASQRDQLAAYMRCGTSPNRIVRLATWLRHGFFPNGLRSVLARAWYLWDGIASEHSV